MTKSKLEKSKARRGHKEGTYTTQPNGRIRWRVWVTDARGSGSQRSGTAETAKKAREAVRELLKAAESNKLPSRSTTTLAEHLALWLTQRDGISNKTRDDYAAIIRRDIVPHIGEDKLKMITPPLLRGFFTTLRDERKLSGNSRRLVYTVLSQALDHAVDDGHLPTNPAKAKGVRPAPERKVTEQLKAYTRDEAGRYFEAATDGHNRPGEALALLLRTGMRKGEALYLKWDAVFLDGNNPYLEVRGTRSQSGGKVYENETGKTDQARRTLPLAPETVALLISVRDRKAEESAALSVPYSPYVFSGLRSGDAYRPDNLDRVHTSVCERAGIRRLNIHALRHTFGSLMAAQGERIEYISKLMGHADPAFTLRQYRHLYPDELQSIFLKLPPPTTAE